jgi:glutaredoxin
MDPLPQRILATYDELERDSLDLHTLFELVGGNAPADREAVLDAVAELVRKGWLRSGDGGDFYKRTEEGRLAIAGPLDVTLYSRPECHLCDEAKEAIAPLLREFGARLRVVNIDDDPELRERYREEIPVIFLGSRKVAKHRVDIPQFRRQLEAAKK